MNTINYKEIEKFSKLSEEWWDPHGKFKPLHKFNPIRIKYIKENIIDQFKARNAGNYVTWIKLPMNTLKIGTYTISLGCSRPIDMEDFGTYQDVIKFEIISNENIAYKSYGISPGVIISRIPWKYD